MIHKFNRQGKNSFKYFPKKSRLLKEKIKHFEFLPRIDIENLLSEEKYVEAILLTSLEIESNLKELFRLKFSDNTIDKYHVISQWNSYNIIGVCFSVGIINMNEYKELEELRKARNEMAHDLKIRNRYIDKDKCQKIVEPILKIIDTTHDKIIEIIEGK